MLEHGSFSRLGEVRTCGVYACDYVQALLALVVHTESPCAFGIKQKRRKPARSIRQEQPAVTARFSPATLHENER